MSSWAEAPLEEYFLIGGSSNSADFTEKPECAEKQAGCAFLVSYNTVSQSFDQKWVFTAVSNVREILFQPAASATAETVFALVFDKVSQSNPNVLNTVLTLSNKWQGRRASLSSNSVTLTEPFDRAQIDDFSKLSFWDQNRLHTIVNNPD